MKDTLYDEDYHKALVKLLASSWRTNEFLVELALKIYKDLITKKEDINSPNLYVEGDRVLVGRTSIEKALRLLARAKLFTREFDEHGRIRYKMNPSGSDACLTQINDAIGDMMGDIKEVILEPKKWPDFTLNPSLTAARTKAIMKARRFKNIRN